MGQRTQIIVEVEEETSRITKETEKKVAVYHNQWGFAKMQMRDIICLLNTYIGYEGFIFPKQLNKAFLLENETLKKTSLKNIKDYLNNSDNNNGGLFIKLKIKDSFIQEGELYIFNDPEADREKGIDSEGVNRVISLWEYIRANPRYFEKDFYKMLLATLKYYNIRIAPKKMLEEDKTSKLKKIIEKSGFNIEKCSNGYNLSQYTPAGEDWNLFVEKLEDIKETSENFDINEEFRVLFNSGLSGVPDVETLLNDQKWKQKTLEELAEKIK